MKPKPLEWSADYRRESLAEQDRAQMEAERNAAEDEYFNTRSDTSEGRVRFNAGYERGWNERNKKVMELQAQVDELMLEYCPNEMTAEQLAEYKKHQTPIGVGEPR